MNDVARLAGVSHQTVSRVLNDHPNVRESTRERVLAAIAELGYRRNSAARALVTHRSGILGIITSGSVHSGPASTLAVLERTARAAGYFVTVAAAPHPTPELMQEIFGSFMDQSVEGVVVIAQGDEVAGAARAAFAEVPLLMISSLTPEPGDPPLVCVDQEAGARLVARYLLDRGHTDVVHLAGPPDWFDARARVRGWHAELSEAGVAPRPDLAGDWSAGSGYEAARTLLADLPTAVFAANDQMALGVLRAFAEAGVAVPGGVSVVGFDDIVGADNFFPPLTTVRQDFEALGRRAIDALVAAMGGAAVPRELVEPVLVERASSGPPRP
ncbi:LacI family DNA-binding transcriptional regulator [Occultella glacieicola]|uniref:LacI family DNA-binding transcriptional regulator n=1 Tax=Occultella glacieicola TaxID=2518684 RepID=A0ABY2DXY1_9MICO|nr:LacI family DNA-binding transcriptional regulator [Occultella glacieicola]TDE89170.1 LacI family DNA-binding transcriptional regulator [Occultella glacieicola]